MDKVLDVFLREKPANIMVALHNTKDNIYASTLAKQVDCTYSHVVKVLQKMENAELVNFEKKGRLKIITLTKKGGDLAENIYKIKNLLK